ncbi:hypothetical protein SMICM17S_07242 [Streptomyces microflavus]
MPWKASSGPPGMPSQKRMSARPEVVRVGITNSSPTPGTRLQRTASNSGCSGRGPIPWTYATARARCGASNGERAASRPNMETSSPLPAETITRS